jgi:sulfhydrogenase subunit alpha
MRSLLVLAALLLAVRVLGAAILIGTGDSARRRTSPTVDPCLGPFVTAPVRRSLSPEGRLAALLIAGAIWPATYRERMTRLACRTPGRSMRIVREGSRDDGDHRSAYGADRLRAQGFYRVSTPGEVAPLRERLRTALDQALDTVRWVAGFDFPDFRHDHEMLALVAPERYAIETGTVATTQGLRFTAQQFEEHVIEEQVPHSTALHARLAGRGRYLVGPAARYALNRQWLSTVARQAADEAGLGADCRNPYRSIVVRAVETVYAVDEAIRLIDRYEPPPRPYVDVPPRAGVGRGATEAPRGILFHRYGVDRDGLITSARIVPPTSQNQAAVEDDLTRFVGARLGLDDERLTHECEQAIRNYDPCISCATHFLDLTVDRGR